jgi:Zn-dependent metalloprotease
MAMRNVVWVLIWTFALSSCGRDSNTRLNVEPPPDSVFENNDPTPNFPSSFYGADKLERDPSGAVSLVQGKNLSNELEITAHYQQLSENGSFGEMAAEFVDFYKIPFQLENPKSELNVTRIQEDDLGFHQVRLAQNYKSVPVMYSEIIMHFDRDDHVYLVQGQYIPTPEKLNLNPAMTLDEVIQGLTDHGDVSPANTDFGPVILPLRDGPPKLVYQLKSQVSLTDQSILLVDANTGEVVRKVSTIYTTN